MKISWKKENFNVRKEFNSHRIFLVHQHGHCFIVLKHQYGRRDVMWETLNSSTVLHQRGTLNTFSLAPHPPIKARLKKEFKS